MNSVVLRMTEDDQGNYHYLGELGEAHKLIVAMRESYSCAANYVDPRGAYQDDDGTDWRQLGAGTGGRNRPLTDFSGSVGHRLFLAAVHLKEHLAWF